MECLVCNRSSSFERYLAGSVHHPEYWRCVECGFVFAFPQTELNYGENPFFDVSESEIATRMANYELRYRMMSPFIRATAPKVLDVGAYGGLFLRFLETKGIRGIGIEPNRAAAEYGRSRLGVEILTVDFEDYRPEVQFDVITLFNVLEHLKNPVEILARIRQILDQNGVLVIEVPNIFHFLCKMLHGYWHHYEHGHYWFFNLKTLETFMDKNGLCLKYINYVPKIIVLSRLMDIVLSCIKLYPYISTKQYMRIRNNYYYKVLSSISSQININNYILAICSLKT